MAAPARLVLILNEAADRRAPALACDEPGCDWAFKLPKMWGDGDYLLADETLAGHMAAEHPEETVEVAWEAQPTWTRYGELCETPDVQGGPPWEPFASYPEVRGDVPGLVVVWRRGPAQDVELKMVVE